MPVGLRSRPPQVVGLRSTPPVVTHFTSQDGEGVVPKGLLRVRDVVAGAHARHLVGRGLLLVGLCVQDLGVGRSGLHA